MNQKTLNIYEACAALVLLFALQFLVVISFIDSGASIINGDPKNSVISVISTGFLISILMKVTNSTYKDIFHLSSNSIFSTLSFLFIPVSLTIIPSSLWLNDLVMFVTNFLPENKQSIDSLNNMLSGGVVTIISICVIAPFLEEMLFRGMFLRGFLGHYSPTRSILYSSILFSVVHFNIYQMPTAFLLGCYVGWLYYVTRSLWPCIFAHSLNNAIAYLAFIYWPQGDFNGIGVNFLSLIISALGILLVARIYGIKLSLTGIGRF
ncbi:CPBP family intramembrane glutamic endopeptidase [Thalassolituus sp. UBA2009]|jgi:membrane protease YdiL (CAAX protease family)|uniref:CPBP family intramembrane glutamic endopeptidase n=1 Tax=Thalassolituus sp. UBA2009 TaxID=1947658 RepID=UPI000C68E79A|nr:type II CAAX endopeptidase family protein [Thalassolituus sp. UBA2009]MAY15655.1 hypothetical protein [Oceanospirillaceae bacterium]|tara:strand:+ start:79 stop:870 length:792 start_codon:yes stop_codon:yes gene_type:complete